MNAFYKYFSDVDYELLGIKRAPPHVTSHYLPEEAPLFSSDAKSNVSFKIKGGAIEAIVDDWCKFEAYIAEILSIDNEAEAKASGKTFLIKLIEKYNTLRFCNGSKEGMLATTILTFQHFLNMLPLFVKIPYIQYRSNGGATALQDLIHHYPCNSKELLQTFCYILNSIFIQNGIEEKVETKYIYLILMRCNQFSVKISFEELKYLLCCCDNLDAIMWNGDTMLIFLLGVTKEERVIELLLDMGANPVIKNKKLPLAVAIYNNHGERTLDKIIDKTTLIDAIYNEYAIDKIKRIMDQGGAHADSYSLDWPMSPLVESSRTFNKRFEKITALSYKSDTPLTYIIKYQDHLGIELVAYLLEKDVDVNKINGFGHSPLISTILYVNDAKQKYALVKLLLDKGARADDVCFDGSTALFCEINNQASMGTDWTLIQALLEQSKSVYDYTVLEELIRELAYPEHILDMLINKSVQAENYPLPTKPLICVMMDNNFIDVIRLIKQCDDTYINEEYNGETPLIHLMRHFFIDFKMGQIAATMLINRGANLNAVWTEKGHTALTLAITYDVPDFIINLIISKHANVNVNAGSRSPLIAAIKYRTDCALVESLIDAGANVNYINGQKNKSVLHYAIEYSPIMLTIQKLLEHGADPNFINGNGENLLIVALKHKIDEEIIKILIGASLNINLVSKHGVFALWMAILYDYSDIIIKQMIDHGANVNCGGVLIKTINETHKYSTIRLLLRLGCNTNWDYCFARGLERKLPSDIILTMMAHINNVTADMIATIMCNYDEQISSKLFDKCAIVDEATILRAMDRRYDSSIVGKICVKPTMNVIISAHDNLYDFSFIESLVRRTENFSTEAIIAAIEHKIDPGLLEIMFEKYGDINLDIIIAIATNDYPISFVESLFYRLTNVDEQTLLCAIKYKCGMDLIYDFLERGLDVNTSYKLEAFIGNRIPNALFAAFMYNYNIDLIKGLIRYGADVDTKNDRNKTVFGYIGNHLEDKVELVDILLGRNVQIKNARKV